MLQQAVLSPDLAPADPALSILVDTIEQLSSARTVEAIAAIVRSQARRLSGADGIAVVMRDNDRCHYVDEDAIGPLWKGRKFPMTACISGWAMLNGQTAVIPDIYLDDRIPHDAYRPTFVKSLVITPVRPADPIAAIGAYWADERLPSDAELAGLEAIARATATAFENAKLYSSLEEALERREFLIQELDHRVKNTLAGVQAIARQTLRSAPSQADFVEAFSGRLQALSGAHELLTREAWGSARLADMAGRVMTPFGGVDGVRIIADGPDLRFAPELAVTVQLAIHELATNAAKYGALSGPHGRVALTWSVNPVEPKTWSLSWRETGGPAVAEPATRGMGSRLVERSLPQTLGGRAKLPFEPDGLRYDLTAPLSGRVELT